ncbi:MAG TPA: CHAD domain-containing protein [Propylenella sp.]|nr:CHAD domain-containing protein [Propylenella sp.]
MAWRIEPGEALADGFRRVAAEEIARIHADLDRAGSDPDRAVHQVRRRLKRLRALMRLARGARGSSFSKPNRDLRDLGRRLAPSRDAAVLTATFDAVVRQLGAAFPPRDVEELRTRLERRSGAHPTAAWPSRQIEEVRTGLDRAERDMGRLSWPKSPAEIARGLRQSQSGLRRSWQAARDGDADAVHEWRKRLKDQLTQLALVRALADGALRARRKVEKSLAEKLGEDRDLLLLQEKLGGPIPAAAEAIRAAVIEEIVARRQKLSGDAICLGEPLASQKPKRFAEEVLASSLATSPEEPVAAFRPKAEQPV